MNAKIKLNTIYGIYGMHVDSERLERMREFLRKKMLVDKNFIYCDTDSIKSESEVVKLK